MSARIDKNGRVFQLDRPAQPGAVVTEEDVQDPKKLARLLQDARRDLDEFKRRADLTFLDFEDRAAVSGTPLQLTHNLDARVRWWVVDWQPTTPGDIPMFERAASTTTKTLVLNVGNNGTATIRVQVAG